MVSAYHGSRMGVTIADSSGSCLQHDARYMERAKISRQTIEAKQKSRVAEKEKSYQDHNGRLI